MTHAGAKRLLEELGHKGEPVIPGKKNATKSSGNDNLKMKLNVKADRFKRFDPAAAAAKFIEIGPFFMKTGEPPRYKDSRIFS